MSGSVPLICSRCQAQAAVVERRADGRGYDYHGLAAAAGLVGEPLWLGMDGLKMMEALEARDYRAADARCWHFNYSGMDCYCPECDAIYCGTHMKVEEVREGIYGALINVYQTCPEGHRRVIHETNDWRG
jgi:hypothetical protein